MIARWLTLNFFIILIIVLWSMLQGYDSSMILIGKVLSQAAFVLFLMNLNMYFIFLFIRKSKVRTVKVTLAQISKRLMKYHIPISITATLLIAGHGMIMMLTHNNSLLNRKIISGIFSFGVLMILLYSGLLRRHKSTGKRRRFHYTTAFLFFGFVFLHIFL